MKDKHTVGGKWPEIAVNKPFIIVIRFDSDYSSKLIIMRFHKGFGPIVNLIPNSIV